MRIRLTEPPRAHGLARRSSGRTLAFSLILLYAAGFPGLAATQPVPPPELQALLDGGDPQAVLDWLSRNPNAIEQNLFEQILADPAMRADPQMRAAAAESLERLAPDPAFEAFKRDYIASLSSSAEAEAARDRLRANLERYGDTVGVVSTNVSTDFGSPPPAPRQLSMDEAQARGDALREELGRRFSEDLAERLVRRVDALEAGETGLPSQAWAAIGGQFFSSQSGPDFGRTISRLERLLRNVSSGEPRRRLLTESALIIALQSSQNADPDEVRDLVNESRSLAADAGVSARDRLALDVNASLFDCTQTRNVFACIPHLEAVLDQAKSTLPPNDPVIAAAAFNVSAMIFQQGRLAEARNHLVDVLNASAADMPPNEVALMQLLLGMLSVELGDFDKGVAYLFQAEATAGSGTPAAALAAAAPTGPAPQVASTPMEALQSTLGPEGLALIEQFGGDPSEFLADLPPEVVQLMTQSLQLNAAVQNPDVDQDALADDLVNLTEQFSALSGVQGMGDLMRSIQDPTEFAASREPEDPFEAVGYYMDKLHALYQKQGSMLSVFVGDDYFIAGSDAEFDRLLGAWLVGYLPDAAAELNTIAASTNEMLQHNLYALAFAEQLAFLTDDVPFQTSLALSLAREGMQLDEPYSAMVGWKGLLADATRRQNAAIEAALAESTFTDRANELLRTREELSARLVTGAANESDVVEQLTARKEDLERQINERFAIAMQPNEQVGLTDLTSILRDGEIFIDLYFYDVYENANYSGTNYAAVVVKDGSTPQMVDLGDAGAIEDAILAWRDAVVGARAPNAPDARAREAAAWDRLKAAVWTPLSAVTDLAGSRPVIIAPDHELSRIPWNLFAEDADVVQVDSARALIDGRRRTASATENRVLLVGDVDFGFGGLQLQQLPFTRDEIDLIASIGEQEPLEIQTLSGFDATEDGVKKALEGVGYAHFATHGLFQSDESSAASSRGFDNAFVVQGASLARNPMMTSGLALTDYNTVTAEMPSGFLTAEELLGLDLSGTELIVLSACNTGRGQEATGQGVIGLRSALTTAGAKSVLLSLWAVDDRATQQLMGYFYEGLWTMGLSKSQALKRAQSLLKETDEFAAPYYWAAWVLVDS